MDARLNKKLLATFADASEALAAQSLLEEGGVPCQVGDLAQLPSQMFGLGTLGRSVGIWVLAADFEGASALLAELRESPGVDEASLAAEALAAHAGAAEVEPPGAPERPGVGASRFSPAARALALVLLLAVALGVAAVVW
jgi:hypothetical protein